MLSLSELRHALGPTTRRPPRFSYRQKRADDRPTDVDDVDQVKVKAFQKYSIGKCGGELQ